MPPTISPLFRLRLSALGEDLNTWGDPNLNNALKLIEEAVASPLTLTITGNRTLTADNFQSNEYRRGTHVLVAGGGLAAPFAITVPPVAYPYRIDNRTAFAATLKTASGVGAVVRPGMISVVFCDGTDCKVADPTLDQVRGAAGPVKLGGFEIQEAGPATSDTGLATRGQVLALTAGSVQLASDWAQKPSGTVDGTEYSAKLWATSTTALTGGNKGAKGYAQDAASSASGAAGSASAASNSAGNAATSETNAAASAVAAATALFSTSTTSQSIATGSKVFTTQAGKAYAVGTRVLITSDANPIANFLSGTVTAYSGTSLTVNVLRTGGTGTFTDWTIRISGADGVQGPAGSNLIARVSRTSNASLGLGNAGNLIDCTGTFTQTLDPAATLGSGWYVYLKNSGTGVITLDPNGAETVDGLTTIRLYPGEGLTIQCDGTALSTVGRQTRVAMNSTTLTGAASAIDSELFAGDAEIIGLELEMFTSQSFNILFKKNGAYIASGATYNHEFILASGASISSSGSNLPYTGGALQYFIGQVAGSLLSTSNGVKMFLSTSGTAQGIQSIVQTESTAATLQGLRLAASSGSFSAGTIFRVWGRR